MRLSFLSNDVDSACLNVLNEDYCAHASLYERFGCNNSLGVITAVVWTISPPSLMQTEEPKIPQKYNYWWELSHFIRDFILTKRTFAMEMVSLVDNLCGISMKTIFISLSLYNVSLTAVGTYLKKTSHSCHGLHAVAQSYSYIFQEVRINFGSASSRVCVTARPQKHNPITLSVSEMETGEASHVSSRPSMQLHTLLHVTFIKRHFFVTELIFSSCECKGTWHAAHTSKSSCMQMIQRIEIESESVNQIVSMSREDD